MAFAESRSARWLRRNTAQPGNQGFHPPAQHGAYPFSSEVDAPLTCSLLLPPKRLLPDQTKTAIMSVGEEIRAARVLLPGTVLRPGTGNLR